MTHLLSRSYGRGGRRYSGDPLALGRSTPGYGGSDDTVTLMQMCFKDSQGLAGPRKWEVIFLAERKKDEYKAGKQKRRRHQGLQGICAVCDCWSQMSRKRQSGAGSP